MSESGRERSDACGGAGGNVEEVDGGDEIRQKDDQKKQIEDCDKRGKRVSFFGFRKGKKQVQRRGKRVNSGAFGCLGKRVGGGGGGGCCVCLKQPQTLDSLGGESQTSDPNNPEFTYEMLRVLIEKNDFGCKECNTHLGIEDLPPACKDEK